MNVFFSYSHKDEALRDQLETHLSVLKRQGVIETWHDRRILAGDEFAGQIDRALEEAEIILLLVSPDFLASDYCYDVEMSRALERHRMGEARVIPVIFRPCDWHGTPFGKLQATLRDGKPVVKWPDRDEAFLDVTTAIKAAVQALSGTASSSPQQRDRKGGSNTVDAARVTTPRSGNLRVGKHFTDHDKDVFLEEAYEFVANYFENSLDELKARNPGLETRFRRIDANHFTATAYREGRAESRCRIWLGRGGFPNGIAYASNDEGSDNSYNEALSVEADEQQLFLRPMMMAHGIGFMHGEQDAERKITHEGGAEYLWSMFIEPLQR